MISLNKVVLLVLIVTACAANHAQVSTHPLDQTLTESQKSLMEGSKKAILKTGISERYFNQHFRVSQVVDKPGDRRVVWKFSINEYEATINDSVGFYTQGSERINTHSVTDILSATSEIKQTIPRKDALRLMKRCLGEFSNGIVEYRAQSGRAALLLTAHTTPKPESEDEAEARERKEGEARERRIGQTTNHDKIEEDEETDRPPTFIASINLQTGKCVKGIGRAGPPRPH